MKKFLRAWRDRRLKKWAIKIVIQGYGYNPDKLKLAEELMEWVTGEKNTSSKKTFSQLLHAHRHEITEILERHQVKQS